MFITDVNVLAVLLAAVASFIIGMLWYSPILFGRQWMELVGMGDAPEKGHALKAMVISFTATLFQGVILAVFIQSLGSTSAFDGALVAFLIALGFVAVTTLTDFLYSPARKPWSLYFISTGYYVVSLVVMGLIIGGWM